MYQLITLTLLSLFANFALAAEPFDFKGVRLGANEAETVGKLRYTLCNYSLDAGKDVCRKNLPLKCDTPKDQHNDRYCYVPENAKDITFAGVNLDVLRATLIGDRLMHVQIIYDKHYYNKVITVLTQAYGNPQYSGTQKWENRFGAHFDSAIRVWQRGGSVIRSEQHIQHYSPFPGQEFSTVTFYLEEYAAITKKRLSEDTKKRAKDL